MDTDPTHSEEPAARATGGCACGSVRYRVVGELRDVINCHCEPCRRFTGHFMTGTAAAIGDMVIESDDTLAWWQRTPTVRYGFCSACGSSLFWEAHDKPDTTSITAGSLDPPTGLATTLAIFGADASDYHQRDPEIDTAPYDRP